jgi:hypothetical protein
MKVNPTRRDVPVKNGKESCIVSTVNHQASKVSKRKKLAKYKVIKKIKMTGTNTYLAIVALTVNFKRL